MLVEADVSGKDFAGRGERAFEVETSTAEARGRAAQCCLGQGYEGRQTGAEVEERDGEGESTWMQQITSRRQSL